MHYLKTIYKTVVYFLKKGIPSHILYFGDSLGDNLLITILARELNNRGYKNVWVKSDHLLLFENNKDLKLVLSYKAVLSTTILKLLNVKMVQLKYTTYIPIEDRDIAPDKHIILKFMECVGLKGSIINQPIINLTDLEKEFGKFGSLQISVCTSSITATVPMKNKEWYTNRYQEIINLLSDTYTFVQIGSKNDAPLRNVIDMRGKTTVRETASILYHSTLLVSHEGFLMHLARAVNCKSVIIYGGRISPQQIGYSCNSNIYQKEECSPCWRNNTCEYDKICMQNISTNRVLKEIELQLSAGKQDLEIDILSF